MKKVLISMCLCGVNTRYDGKSITIDDYSRLKEKYILIPMCPEIMGGLSTPRDPSEIKNDKVISNKGVDVTNNFDEGAKCVLKLCQDLEIDIAILKENSPSCGVNFIYDGNFDGTKISGSGVTTKLLKENNIEVYSENAIGKFLSMY